MGGYADLSYGNRTRSASSYEKSQDAQVFLKRFFYVLAFISALMIAGSHQAGDDSATTTQQPVVAPPPQPQMAQNQGLPQQPQQQQYYSASPVEGTVHAPVPVPAAYGHA
jgi:hypothetical protein